MNKFYSKVVLPELPTHLIVPLSELSTGENICPTAALVENVVGSHGPDDSIFQVYDASKEIYDIYEPQFDFPVFIRWQVVIADLPPHYDWGKSYIKYLYLVDTGGDNVTTKFWEEKPDDPVTGGTIDPEGRKVVFEVSENIRSWHTLNVGIPHSVTNMTRPRIALIIRQSNYQRR